MPVTLHAAVPINIASIYNGPLPHRLAQCTPDTKAAIEAVARDLAGMGFGIRLSDLFRSHDQQAQSHADFVEGRKKAFSPPPGGSLHEAGRAMDIDLSSIGVPLPKFWEIAKAHGFTPIIDVPDPHRSESWHFDCRGSHHAVYEYVQSGKAGTMLAPYTQMAESAISAIGVKLDVIPAQDVAFLQAGADPPGIRSGPDRWRAGQSNDQGDAGRWSRSGRPADVDERSLASEISRGVRGVGPRCAWNLWRLFLTLQLEHKPGPRESPVAHDGIRGDFQYGGSLLHAEAAEEPKLDHLSLARIHHRERIQRVVERDQFASAPGRDVRNFVQIDARLISTPFRPGARPRCIQQNVPHDARRYGEEVGPVLPVHIRHIDQAYIGFVHQGCSLHGAARALILHEMAGNAPQFAINPRRELVQGGRFAIRPGAEKFRGFRCLGVSHQDLGSPYYSPPVRIPPEKDRPCSSFCLPLAPLGRPQREGTMTIIRMALMAWMAGTVAHAAQPQTKITVYMRDQASIKPWVGADAKALAGQMFAWIGISVAMGDRQTRR